MQEAAQIIITDRGAALTATITPGTPLPIDALLLGRPLAEAAEILPRLFNLCRAAQGTAAHLALGLPLTDQAEMLRSEILRDHMIKLFLSWPALLGLPPTPFPKTADTAAALFGPAAQMPHTPAAFADWLAAAQGAAPVLAALRDTFAPGEAAANLPDITPTSALSLTAQENSPALRHPGHPVLQALETTYGRGPLWRATARLIDAEACLTGILPASQTLPDGTVLTPASRGTYAVRARSENGRVTAFQRVTPTDHLLAANGMFQASIASLPAAKRSLASLVLDILDPCAPITLTQVMAEDAENA